MKAAVLLALVATGAALSVHAQQAAPVQALQAASVAQAPMTDGEVRKIDKNQGKITLRHGPIANLEMPGMTMVFTVADPKMLGTVKEGDKVKFAADKVNGVFVVSAIEPAAKQ